MKLVRVGAPGQERPGLIDNEGRIRDLSGVIDDVAGEHITNAGLDTLRALDVSTLPLLEGELRYGAAVGQIGKFICVGLNYADHAAESGMDVPKMPILFMKATTAVSGPNDTVIIPRGSVKSDWEVELGVVIGDVARDVSVDEALNHVAGYAVINDLSEREFQLEHGGQWVKGKSADTFGRSARGWSPAMKSPTRRTCRCGWRSMATATRTAAPARWCSAWPNWSATSAAT